jgi:hypothetical protein
VPSGRQVAKENVDKFVAWCASKTDDDYRALASRGLLSRTEIAAECGFDKSALRQNPWIKNALKELEGELRDRGVLPKTLDELGDEPAELPLRSTEGVRVARDAERLKRLEQENASLRTELGELKRQLARYAVLQEVLADTGRLPR